MRNEQVFGQVSGDFRTEAEVLVHPGRLRVEVGGGMMENKRLGAQGDAVVSVVGAGLKKNQSGNW